MSAKKSPGGKTGAKQKSKYAKHNSKNKNPSEQAEVFYTAAELEEFCRWLNEHGLLPENNTLHLEAETGWIDVYEKDDCWETFWPRRLVLLDEKKQNEQIKLNEEKERVWEEYKARKAASTDGGAP